METLLRNADLAMYQAKATGEGRLALYAEGMAVQARCRAELAEDLAAALAAGDQLQVHYQDIVALSKGQVVGVEALRRTRWSELGPGVGGHEPQVDGSARFRLVNAHSEGTRSDGSPAVGSP